MTKNCLVTFFTSIGHGVAEINVNSLHQLAVLMPASVVSYEVQDNGDEARGPVSDVELYELLLDLVSDINAHRNEAADRNDLSGLSA